MKQEEKYMPPQLEIIIVYPKFKLMENSGEIGDDPDDYESNQNSTWDNEEDADYNYNLSDFSW